jgi:hypothetical protein
MQETRLARSLAATARIRIRKPVLPQGNAGFVVSVKSLYRHPERPP